MSCPGCPRASSRSVLPVSELQQASRIVPSPKFRSNMANGSSQMTRFCPDPASEHATPWTATWEGKESTATLLILPNLKIGVYLKFLKTVAGQTETWLSLRDPSRLNEVVECGEEWYVSVGLFLEPKAAWDAVRHFCETGGKASGVTWISPDQIPEDGNW